MCGYLGESILEKGHEGPEAECDRAVGFGRQQV